MIKASMDKMLVSVRFVEIDYDVFGEWLAVEIIYSLLVGWKIYYLWGQKRLCIVAFFSGKHFDNIFFSSYL